MCKIRFYLTSKGISSTFSELRFLLSCIMKLISQNIWVLTVTALQLTHKYNSGFTVMDLLAVTYTVIQHQDHWLQSVLTSLWTPQKWLFVPPTCFLSHYESVEKDQLTLWCFWQSQLHLEGKSLDIAAHSANRSHWFFAASARPRGLECFYQRRMLQAQGPKMEVWPL